MLSISRQTLQRSLVAITVCYLLLVIASPRNPSLLRGLQSKVFDEDQLRSLKREEHFNSINPHSEWCPIATCDNTPMCAPCDRRFLFIIGTGRSGSTTLLSLFNKIPGVRLSGENWGELNIAADLNKNLEKGWFDPHFDAKGPFKHHPIQPQSLACVHQHLAHALDPPDAWMQHFSEGPVQEYDSETILGMKTIRIQDKEWTPEEAAEYFKTNFPCARFLINIRSNHQSQKNSVLEFFYGTDQAESDRIVDDGTIFLKNLATELGPASAMILDRDEWKKDVWSLERALYWMGFKDCNLSTEIQRHESDYELDEVHISPGNSCRYAFS